MDKKKIIIAIIIILIILLTTILLVVKNTNKKTNTQEDTSISEKEKYEKEMLLISAQEHQDDTFERIKEKFEERINEVDETYQEMLSKSEDKGNYTKSRSRLYMVSRLFGGEIQNREDLKINLVLESGSEVINITYVEAGEISYNVAIQCYAEENPTIKEITLIGLAEKEEI